MQIGGRCDPRFVAVETALTENLTARGELGAAVCVVVDGIVVADIWGGWRDAARTEPWQRDTLVNVFSVGKGMAAACLARLAGQSLVDFDTPVARIWPDFAAAGKGSITLRQLLSHQAGLPAVRRRLPPGMMLDHPAMAATLAAETPWWEPGSAHGYHVNTYGFLLGEVVRRATGISLGRYLRQEITGPLGADAFIGLPTSEHRRAAEFVWPAPAPPEEEPAGMSNEQLLSYNAYYNPSGLSGAGVVNSPEWRAAEIPSTNAHATARGVARFYQALAAGGQADGVEVVNPTVLVDAATEQVYGEDLVLRRPSRFGLGFQLTQPERPLGPNPGAFGHFGAGGSLGFCDPEAKVAFGYVVNEMGPRWQNPRNRALIDALYQSLG
jgi:CubicO group peptidase (beta-lactamase class C family)